MERGTVKWFSEEKGYGFITSDVAQKEFFVHSSKVNNLERNLEKGDRVEFEIDTSAAKPAAKNVQLLPN